MKITEKYIAKVVDNDDSTHTDGGAMEGRIKFYIPELMADLGSDEYPWARQDRSETSDIPEIGEYVWVYWHDEEYKRNPYYGNKVTLKAYHDHLIKLTTIKALIPTLLTSNYPDVKFKYLANGIAWGASSNPSTPEFFIIHPTGSAISIDTLGNITLKTGDAAAWKPNSLQIDPFTGLPHGGLLGGIIKLKGA